MEEYYCIYCGLPVKITDLDNVKQDDFGRYWHMHCIYNYMNAYNTEEDNRITFRDIPLEGK